MQSNPQLIIASRNNYCKKNCLIILTIISMYARLCKKEVRWMYRTRAPN